MDHGASTHWGEDLAAGYKAKLGVWMFLAYSAVYAGFVVINSVWPEAMAIPVGRLNLAIVYGMGLIVLALVMAFIYNHFSRAAEERYDAILADCDAEEAGSGAE